MQWELIENSKGDVHFSNINSPELCNFRWPFFAYVLGEDEIVINPLAKKEYIVHYKLDIPEGARIHKLRFSWHANLYILVLTDTETIYYRLKVGSDMS